MSILIATRVSNKINSTITQEMYETFSATETDAAIFTERLAQVEKAMNICVSLDDAWNMALGLADLWMPTPSRSPYAYNSVEYNTIEIFCLCIKKARRYL